MDFLADLLAIPFLIRLIIVVLGMAAMLVGYYIFVYPRGGKPDEQAA